MPRAAGLTVQHQREQNTGAEKETGTKKPKSRLHGYVKILQTPGGVDVQVLFDSIREDISYILRVQMQKHKRLFMRWSPKLNVDASLVGSQLERPEAALVLNSCEPVFRMITKALHDGALPAGHLCRALSGSIVHCTRVDVGTDSGAAAGDILWHAMCTRCLQELRTYVHCKKLEKVDISPKPHSMYARMLQIKQFGDCEVYVYQPRPTRHDVWPCKPGACATCNATSGIIRKYKLEPGGVQKAQGGGARKSRAKALGGPPRSFQRIFREQCSDSFESESETTQTAGARGAACGGAGVGGSEEEEDDRDYECEDLLSSDDDRDAGPWQGHARDIDGFWSDKDSDEGVEQGQEHLLSLHGDDFDAPWSVHEFFAMDEDMQANVQEFLLDMRAASPLAQTCAPGAADCAGGCTSTDTGTRTEMQAAAGAIASASTSTNTGTRAEMQAEAGPSASASTSTDTGTGPGAGASASTDTGTGAEPQAAVLPTASPGADASASTDTGTRAEMQAAVPTPGRKKSAMDYVLNPGWVQSSARAGVAFALRMLQQSVQGDAQLEHA